MPKEECREAKKRILTLSGLRGPVVAKRRQSEGRAVSSSESFDASSPRSAVVPATNSHLPVLACSKSTRKPESQQAVLPVRVGEGASEDTTRREKPLTDDVVDLLHVGSYRIPEKSSST